MLPKNSRLIVSKKNVGAAIQLPEDEIETKESETLLSSNKGGKLQFTPVINQRNVEKSKRKRQEISEDSSEEEKDLHENVTSCESDDGRSNPRTERIRRNMPILDEMPDINFNDIETQVIEKKKEVVTVQQIEIAGGPVRCSFTIHCANQMSFAQFISYATCLKKKLLFMYLLKILQRKVPNCICTSGSQFTDIVLSIITHFETWRSSQEKANIYIRVHGPEGNVIVMTESPCFLVTVKDLILTPSGSYEMKVDSEGMRFAEKILGV